MLLCNKQLINEPHVIFNDACILIKHINQFRYAQVLVTSEECKEFC